ncbi:MAG TPA: hypothetical protein VFT55_09345 [Planctomycetota bacterium]|nr:hypothetical protein [Planctomycetota bacterium]
MIAIGLAIAAWSALLAIGQRPMRTAPPRAIEDLVRPEAPQRLPAGFEVKREVAAADAEWQPGAPIDVAIRVSNLPRALHGTETGLAVMAETGADFDWIPLAETTAAPDGSLIATSKSRAGDKLVVILACSRAFARHGYLARCVTQVRREPAGALAEIPFDLDVTTVRLQLPPAARRAGPLQLRRVDDPQWLPLHCCGSGITLVGDSPLDLLLGAGQYDLSDPLDPTRRQRFVAPSKDPIVVNDSLAVLRAGRP